ncbi:tautomerase family protein [Clostridium estertheticum]|uniref:4-oxalocrotonate tautomerase n=1 Tax=Clostridium estertheticum TaxID=238834 RepID=A0A7Y3SYF4_9CLOT|nr:4-oxalocrotonate tautomerase DmpI [Clostridium estertheticum]MBU3074813.1 tautomerase family protein [Clostridium estertheticum]MBU3165028.1 tautomerase family protein [Clostridium estertheticum]MBU3214717.1 tautomerase family protein [Clostridium estertheticum]MBW9173053.1 tautomerase family protein [Clostridium estertheticum]NNU77645.1 4-oxalocrotonate tautomerase [Clostridium estertheticum]
MPVITLEAGKLNKNQKSQMVKEFTTIASKVMNVPEQAFTVLIKENEQDNIGFGGQLLSDK